MDKTTAIVIVAGIFAAVAAYLIYRYGGKIRMKLSAPGVKLEAQGENAPPSPAPATTQPGIRIKDAEGRNLRAQDATGRGIDAEKLRAKGDIDLSSSTPGGTPPKR